MESIQWYSQHMLFHTRAVKQPKHSMAESAHEVYRIAHAFGEVSRMLSTMASASR